MPMPAPQGQLDPRMRNVLAQLLMQRALQQQQGGQPLPPSGGFADTVSREQPMPNAGASNMSIQPGRAR